MDTSCIVVFLADGTARFNAMTANALQSFLSWTPRVPAGLIVLSEAARDEVLSRLDEAMRARVEVHIVRKPRFRNWNPTQYKLELALFVHYTNVFWMDSDTLVYGDMTPLLQRFAHATEAVYLLPDHVMHDPLFVQRWRAQHPEAPEALIPQACFMGFKVAALRDLFPIWEQVWRSWIEPAPFGGLYPDPNPDFAGSSFCIEQYALGLALSRFTKNSPTSLVLTVPRAHLFLGGVPAAIAASAARASSAPSSWQSSWSSPLSSAVSSYGFSASGWPSSLQSSSSSSSSSSWSSAGFVRGGAANPFAGDAAVRVDNIGGVFIHTYSVFYERVRQWFDAHFGPELAARLRAHATKDLHL